MTRGDPLGVDAVGLHEQIAELRECVAAHARNGRASTRVFAHEVVDDVAAERTLEVEHVVRHAEGLADAARIVHRVERAARTVWQIVAMAEQLHRRTDDVVALLDEHCRSNRRIHAARHGDQHALLHRCSYPARAIPCAFSTSAGKTSATRSMHSSVVSEPRLMRIADDASSGSTPIAANTCDGVMLPD